MNQCKHVDPSPQCIEINRPSLFSRAVIISPIITRWYDLHKQVLQPCLIMTYSTKVPSELPTTTTASLLKSSSVQTASLRGLCPGSLCLCPSSERNPLCCLDSDCTAWKSLVCGETREEGRLRRRASSEPLSSAAPWGTSGV